MSGTRIHPNALYQATVEALEGVLPPRVVSRALKEGLAQFERDPSTVTHEDLDAIMKGSVFRHLQATASPDQARATVLRLIEELRSAPATDDSETSTAHQDTAAPDARVGAERPAPSPTAARLDQLDAALRPFNLYFDWPEVRKLRALLQVARTELEEDGAVESTLDQASAQLRLVEQKLEDRLVLQARELGELEEALELVVPLGGPRVRRLEALVGQVRQAQADRTLAEAEIERGRRLARDLRKLMESSVLDDTAPPGTSSPEHTTTDAPAAPAPGAPSAPSADDPRPGAPPAAHEGPEAVSARLLSLDLDAEAKDLASSEEEHAELLRFLPDLRERFDDLRAALDARTSIAAPLRGLSATMREATERQRGALDAELAAIRHDLESLHPEVDAAPLERALRVTQDVLAEGLPSHADVVGIRDLHRSALERSEELATRDREARLRAEAGRLAQAEALERLDAALARDDLPVGAADEVRTELGAVRDELDALQRSGSVDPAILERAQRAEARWERAVVERVDDERERRLARLRELQARLAGLPDLGGLPARTASLRDELTRALEGGDPEQEQVEALGSLVDALHGDARAEAERKLDQLGKDAGDGAGEAVLRALQDAARTLAAGRFPDLAHLGELVDAERSAARERDHVRAQRLQLEAARLDASGVGAVEGLRASLALARSELEQGRSARRHLDAAEAAVAEAERQLGERLDAFPPRLDAALERFRTVERLNNDEVATARRVLAHLDSQRAAIARVSPGLQNQLVEALAEAERLLDGLGQAFEATRAVADQLVAGGVLDDVLDFFGEGAGERDQQAGTADDAGTAEAGDGIDRLMREYLRLDSVRAAAVINRDAELHAGSMGAFSAPDLVPALVRAHGRWDELAARLGSGEAELVDIDLGAERVLVVPVTERHAAVLVIDAAAASSVTERLRHDRERLRTALADAR